FDHEVFYKNYGYEHKPFLGIIVGVGDYNYFIPLTSAKPHHSSWSLIGREHFLIYETKDICDVNKKSVYKTIPNDELRVNCIIGAIILNKMIPIPEGQYFKIDIDNMKDAKYQRLLRKEFSFCSSIKDDLIKRIKKIYDSQINTGHIRPRYVNFKVLEKACDNYKK
ncbi:MAG: type III toxin-antitoxin system ToxN/AbiQ family toxin, partial [Coprobacillus sp.]|nr:type III toxin-antitoxin system ToxN/AbiQ family toxin [Coprobacillus sp.]